MEASARKREMDEKLFEYFGHESFKSEEQREASLAVLESGRYVCNASILYFSCELVIRCGGLQN